MYLKSASQESYWSTHLDEVGSLVYSIGDQPRGMVALASGKPANDHAVMRLQELRELVSTSGCVTVVADVDLLKYPVEQLLGVACADLWCLYQGGKAVWPNLATGHSVEQLVKLLRMADMPPTAQMHLIYHAQIAVLSADEQQLLLATQRLRNVRLRINHGARRAAQAGLRSIMADIGQSLGVIIGADVATRILGGEQVDEAAALAALDRRFGVSLRGTSLDLVDVGLLVHQPDAARAVLLLKRARAVSTHLGNLTKWQSQTETPICLQFAGAHTRRWSCKSRFLNVPVHGLPKSDKTVAKLMRSTFRLPPDLCAVRGDLAQAEFRKAGELCGCPEVRAIFDPAVGGRLLTDPYGTQWLRAFNQEVGKKSPQRMLMKTATIAQTYQAGEKRVIISIALAVADPANGLSLAQVETIAQERGFMDPATVSSARFQRLLADLRVDAPLVALGSSLFAAFKRQHARFDEVAEWLVWCVDEVAKSVDVPSANQQLDRLRRAPRAPEQAMVSLRAARSPRLSLRPSVLVRIGTWSESLTWREPAYRCLGSEHREQLSIIGSDGKPRVFNKALALQNLVQAGTRNDIARGLVELERRGHRHVPTVHDEVLVIVPRTVECVLKARADLLDVYGDKSALVFGWPVMMDPAELTVTESLWEDLADIDPQEGRRWERIEGAETGCLDGLP